MQLKRLWDTDGKKTVFTEGPTGHQCQVWGDESGKLYIYDMAQWLTYNGVTPVGKEYVRSNWVVLTDEEVGFYDSNEPTELYSWDSGDKASYKFVDWDGTVLKSGTVEEGETPEAPADPTREATAQYTYTFAGWNPEVGPITKKTTYTATYTAEVNTYTVTINVNDSDFGYTEPGTITSVPYGTEISVDDDNIVHVGTATVTPHANAGYEFVSWGELPTAVTGATTITATFEAITQYTVTIQSNNTDYGTVDESELTVDEGTTLSAVSNVLTVGSTDVTATAETGYEFVSWTVGGESLPTTVTSNITITATFQAETPAPFTPGANTLLYYPFTTSQTDQVGQSSISLTGTQETLGYTFSDDHPMLITDGPSGCNFLSFWMKYATVPGNATSQSPSYGYGLLYNMYHNSGDFNQAFQVETTSQWETSNTVATSADTWYHVAMGYDGSNIVCYVNGTNVWTFQVASASLKPTGSDWQIGTNIEITLSELIGESVCWSAQDIADYFNATKGNYGYNNL